MSKVIMGADVSGIALPRGQVEYIALVLGTPDSIEKVHQKIGMSSIHMSLLTKSKRRRVVQNVDLGDKDVFAMCLHVQKQEIVEGIQSNPRFRSKNPPKIKIYRHFDYLMFKKIRRLVESFVFPRKSDLKDVIMQCDPDMVKTGTYWNMNIEKGGKAYEIADVIAWCNTHNIKISQCKEIDLADKIRTDMQHDLLK